MRHHPCCCHTHCPTHYCLTPIVPNSIPRQPSNTISHIFSVLPLHRQDDRLTMDDENRQQVFRNLMFEKQKAQNRVQPGAGPSQPSMQPEQVQPEQRTFSPNPYPQETRMFTPAPPPTNIQSRVPAYTPHPPTYQGCTASLPEGVISHNITPTSQMRPTMMQRVFQPAQQQQQLSSGFGPLPFFNNTNGPAYQMNQMRQGAPHARFDRGPHQTRHHPYQAPPSRTPYSPPQSYPQNAVQAPLLNNRTPTAARSYGTAQPQLPDISQVPSPFAQNFSHAIRGLQLTQHALLSQASLPHVTMYSPRGPGPFHVRQALQSASNDGLSLPQFQLPRPVQSYGRIQVPIQNTSQTPRSSVSNSVYLPQTQPRVHPQHPNPNPNPSHGTAKLVTQSTPQPLLSNVLPPTHRPQVSHPPNVSPQSTPSPPRVWSPQLHTVTWIDCPLKAQPDHEANNPNFKKLVDAMQKRDPQKLLPDQYLDYLTMEHNACFKPKPLKVYDVLFMQALFFVQDHVLLVSPKELATPCWAPPQSVLRAPELSAPILHHILKTLNAITDLQPNEVGPCKEHRRHDSAVDIVKNNSGLVHAWSISLSCEIHPHLVDRLKPRHFSTEFNRVYCREQQVKGLDMDPVWKAKVLEVFELRRQARMAKREDSLMGR
jgi:hypothetical protein